MGFLYFEPVCDEMDGAVIKCVSDLETGNRVESPTTQLCVQGTVLHSFPTCHRVLDFSIKGPNFK